RGWRAALTKALARREPRAGSRLASWIFRWGDIWGLTHRGEQRMIMLLLLTERPPRLYRYPLPRHTPPPRHLARPPTPEHFLSDSIMKVISYTELQKSLAAIGLTDERIAALDQKLDKAVSSGDVRNVRQLLDFITGQLPDPSRAGGAVS